MKISEDILFFAFRYALGRRTGAVGIVVDSIKENWDKLKPQTQVQIQEEIDTAIDKDQAGSDCDVRDWESILKLKVSKINN